MFYGERNNEIIVNDNCNFISETIPITNHELGLSIVTNKDLNKIRLLVPIFVGKKIKKIYLINEYSLLTQLTFGNKQKKF